MNSLLERMVEALTQIQSAVSVLAQRKWGNVLELLKKRLEALNEDEQEERKESEKLKTLYLGN